MRRVTVRPARARAARITIPPPATYPPVNTTPAVITDGYFTTSSSIRATSPSMTLTVTPGVWNITNGATTVVGKWMRLRPLPMVQYGSNNDAALLITEGMLDGTISYVETATRDGFAVEVRNSGGFPQVTAVSPVPSFVSVTTALTGDFTVGGAINRPTYVWTTQPDLLPLVVTGEWWKNGNPTGESGATYSNTAEGDRVYWIERAEHQGGGFAYGPYDLYTTPELYPSLIAYVSDIIHAIRANMRSQVLDRIDGLPGGATNMNYLSAVNHANSAYTFNADNWAADLRHQLSANQIGAYVNTYADITGQYGFVAITGRHMLTCGHIGNVSPRVVRFLTHDNRVVESKVIAYANAYQDQNLSGDGLPNADLQVMLMDRDLDQEGIPAIPILGCSYMEYQALLSERGDPIPLIGFSQDRRVSGTPPGPYSDYPLTHRRMLYLKSNAAKGSAGSPEFNDFNYGVYKGDSGTPEMLLINDNFFIVGPITTAPFGEFPAGLTNFPVAPYNLQNVINQAIIKAEQKAIAAGTLSGYTGKTATFVPLASLMTHPSPAVITASATPTRGWFINTHVQTKIGEASVPVRATPNGTSTATLSYSRRRAVIVEGPLYVGATWWYRLDFDNGALATGWVDAAQIEAETANAVPVAQNASASVQEDGSVQITLNATDADNVPLTYAISDEPTKGTVELSGTTATYTPDVGGDEVDSFTFTASDLYSTSTSATVSISIVSLPANNPPVAYAQSLDVIEGATLPLTLTATDPDGDSLTYTVLTQPTKGTLSGTAPNLIYTPTAGQIGADTFTFKANDGTDDSNTATVSVTIEGASSTTSITYYGITWTFAGEVQSGQFVTGEPWVVGPVTVTAISPNTTDDSFTGSNHGSMVNPIPAAAQGFDDRFPAWGAVSRIGSTVSYNASLNVALSLPKTLVAGDVLVSSESIPFDRNTHFQKMCALTVLSAPPPANSFRPCIFGTDRTVRWNADDIDWSKLKNLSYPNPNVTEYNADRVDIYEVEGKPNQPEHMPALPWFEWDGAPDAASMRPRENFADFSNNPYTGLRYNEYGRDVAERFGIAVSWLNTNQPLGDKKRIALKLIQQGLDIYGYATSVTGAPYYADGGHNCGRKLPCLFAAVMLGDADVLALCQQQSPLIFQEDQQVWIVTQADVGRAIDPSVPGRPEQIQYVQGDVGKAEWGIRHYYEPNQDNANWSASYRGVVGDGLLTEWLAASIMGIRTEWNYSPAFAYLNRYKTYDVDCWGTVHHHAAFNRFLWNNHYTP